MYKDTNVLVFWVWAKIYLNRQGRGRSDNSLKEPISKSNIMAIVSKAVSKINVLLINKHELTVNALS